MEGLEGVPSCLDSPYVINDNDNDNDNDHNNDNNNKTTTTTTTTTNTNNEELRIKTSIKMRISTRSTIPSLDSLPPPVRPVCLFGLFGLSADLPPHCVNPAYKDGM